LGASSTHELGPIGTEVAVLAQAVRLPFGIGEQPGARAWSGDDLVEFPEESSR
jgi:hypothetical protein